VRTRDLTQKVDCKKRMKKATRGCSLFFSFCVITHPYTHSHPPPTLVVFFYRGNLCLRNKQA